MKGIYKIIQKSTGKVYIGQSTNIDNRWNQHANAVDNLSFHKAYRAAPTDFTFEIVEQNDDYTKEDLDRLEKQYITDCRSNDPKYGFNGTAGNGDGKKSTKKTKILPVGYQIVESIFDLYIENQIKDKKVLTIGVFKTIPEYLILKNCDVTILTDDFDYTCEKAKIIRFDGGKELVNKIKEIKKDEYNLIIANPPYNKGNEIIAGFVNKVKESIALAPANCYRDNSVYKHIVTTKLVNPKAFKDASITKNLNISKLIDREIDQTYVDIYLANWVNPEFKDFYQHNIKKVAKWKVLKNLLKEQNIDNYDIQKTFIIPSRGTNGVCKNKDTADFYYNMYNEKRYIGSYALELDSVSKHNLAHFYYNNPLMNELLVGLNNSGGSNLCYLAAIPHIDWSKDRDYEHCTLDDIMKWLDEDNK